MHGYIYDVFLHQKPYEKEVIEIEHTLTDAGLNGHIVRLSIVNNVQHAVEELIKRGATTIVAVGSDQLFSKLADQVVDLPNITLGLIPLGTHQDLAGVFGIPQGHKACHTISARLVRPVHLCKINSAYFIHSVSIYDPRVKLVIDKKFSLTATSPQAQFTILNERKTDPTTGSEIKTLQAIITPATEKKLFKKEQRLEPTTIESPEISIIEPRGVQVVVDGQKIINTPVNLSISDQSIRVIMGKDRIIF